MAQDLLFGGLSFFSYFFLKNNKAHTNILLELTEDDEE